MTGLAPERRFENHKNGIKAARIVKKSGERLVPRLYAHLNPMPYKKAQAMEVMLADSLRKRGYVVFGGHCPASGSTIYGSPGHNTHKEPLMRIASRWTAALLLSVAAA